MNNEYFINIKIIIIKQIILHFKRVGFAALLDTPINTPLLREKNMTYNF